MKILLVEDDAEAQAYLSRALGEMGWEVSVHATPKTALLELGGRDFDTIILDRMLPGMDGLDALKLIRGAGISTPVIMLTAMGGLCDRVAGLDSGADDYLTKPFAISELVARVKAIARRPEIAQQVERLQLGPLSLDRLARTVSRAGVTLDLSSLEFRLLEYLMQHPGEVVTRAMLLEHVWGYRFDPKTSLVQTHMSRLRAKLDKPFEAEMLRTVRGAGYVIDAPA